MSGIMHYFFLGIWISISNGSIAQVQPTKDTFLINGVTFEIATPSDWNFKSIKNELQPDSSWNYSCDKVGIDGTYSIIGIQIVSNSLTELSKREKRQLKRSCTTLSTVLIRWPASIIDFRYAPIPDCKECLPVKSLVYSIPLNPCQSLNFVLNTQANKILYPSIKETFTELVNQFLKTNSFSLRKFDAIDFTVSQPTDTLKIGNFTLKAIVPYNFEIEKFHEGNSSAYILNYISPCNRPFSLNVIAQSNEVIVDGNSFSRGAYFDIKDTTARLISAKPIGARNNVMLVQTKRKVSFYTNSYVVLEISIPIGSSDELTISYCKNLIRAYADRMALANSTSTNVSKPILKRK